MSMSSTSAASLKSFAMNIIATHRNEAATRSTLQLIVNELTEGLSKYKSEHPELLSEEMMKEMYDLNSFSHLEYLRELRVTRNKYRKSSKDFPFISVAEDQVFFDHSTHTVYFDPFLILNIIYND